ncbi:nicotinate phosphoribosyltransferase [Candidatus Bathyarchaeota archaeon]|nr:MAG: nicotinate phosphoribosyltransferase [Candidatus Bathyarchaeota archaeon]RLG93852.1 MAG: nicotinate phosphoribosyltransferase [Candidatus Bathyarchaeota archaeon]HDJ05077.1 nicotinate phosphoribosyltransferase [Candidatus Bathyarchaeota archaeon]
MRLFYYADDSEIKEGKTTDIYFVRTKQVLEAKGMSHIRVLAEVTPGGLPEDWPWGVLSGVEEVSHLFEGCPVNVYSMPEGSIFYAEDFMGRREPVMFIEGPYGEFCTLETPLLGLLCQSSGVSTKAARIRKVAGEKLLVAFGIRRMHPAISPMLDRAAYIGGFDGVSSLKGAEVIGAKPMGTMPHALIIVIGDQVEAWKAFDDVMPPDVPRVCIADTYFDEKAESIMAAEALKDRLVAVRLDTPRSRKGDFAQIVREVRWELDVRGYKHVKVFVSGGLNEESVKALSEAGADAFGVGTSVSNAPTVDFAMDIVEVEGRPAAKRGKLSGKKQVWRCPSCMVDIVQPFDEPMPRCPKCGGETSEMLKPLIKDGRIVADLPKPREIRRYVLDQLKRLPPIL